MQSWPALAKQARTAPLAAAATSASASTTIGFLPPSSREQPISRSPARAAIRLPAAVDPVNATKSASSTSVSPMTAGSPSTICHTSRGIPALTRASRSHSEVSAVWVSGFCTTVLPAAMAGNTSAARASG
jgi:hypothetical protein